MVTSSHICHAHELMKHKVFRGETKNNLARHIENTNMPCSTMIKDINGGINSINKTFMVNGLYRSAESIIPVLHVMHVLYLL